MGSWQTVIVWVLIVGAAAFLAWRLTRRNKKREKCEQCPAMKAMLESPSTRRQKGETTNSVSGD